MHSIPGLFIVPLHGHASGGWIWARNDAFGVEPGEDALRFSQFAENHDRPFWKFAHFVVRFSAINAAAGR